MQGLFSIKGTPVHCSKHLNCKLLIPPQKNKKNSGYYLLKWHTFVPGTQYRKHWISQLSIKFSPNIFLLKETKKIIFLRLFYIFFLKKIVTPTSEFQKVRPYGCPKFFRDSTRFGFLKAKMHNLPLFYLFGSLFKKKLWLFGPFCLRKTFEQKYWSRKTNCF